MTSNVDYEKIRERIKFGVVVIPEWLYQLMKVKKLNFSDLTNCDKIKEMLSLDDYYEFIRINSNVKLCGRSLSSFPFSWNIDWPQDTGLLKNVVYGLVDSENNKSLWPFNTKPESNEPVYEDYISSIVSNIDKSFTNLSDQLTECKFAHFYFGDVLFLILDKDFFKLFESSNEYARAFLKLHIKECSKYLSISDVASFIDLYSLYVTRVI